MEMAQNHIKTGVSVDLQGGELMHSATVLYPRDAVEQGIQGEVVVSVALDSQGNVREAHAVSGPPELQDAALESVRQWHFLAASGTGTRLVKLRFDPAAQKAIEQENMRLMESLRQRKPAPPPEPPQIPMEGCTVKSVTTSGLSDAAGAALLQRLPLRAGDRVTAEGIRHARQVVREFDPHLALVTMQAGPGEVTVTVMAPGYKSARLPQRIRVDAETARWKLISCPKPEAPAGAEGPVRLAAVIGKDGSILDLQVLSGDPGLGEAAMKAVRNWLFAPVLLNGNAVEVATEIEVNFSRPN